jgi:hypothetical protein
VTNRGAGGRARRELRLVQMKPITARAPQAASAGVPLVLIQDARARKVNGDVIVRRRPRRTDECGFDHRRGMRAIVDLGPCAMALRSILDADMGSSAAPIQKEESSPAERIRLVRRSEVMEPRGTRSIVQVIARQPRRY